MQTEHSKPAMEISSVSLARRGFLAGTAALAVSIGAATVADASAIATDNYDELMMLIDQRRELEAQYRDALTGVMHIELRPDRPRYPAISLFDVFDERHRSQYYRWEGNRRFVGAEALNELREYFEIRMGFAVNRAKHPEGTHWPTVITKDYTKAFHALQSQVSEYDAWEERSGLRRAEGESFQLSAALAEIEQRIYSLPCKSSRDIRAKLDEIDREPDVCYDDMWTILVSIKDFANCCPAAATGQHVPDRARA